MFDMNGFIELKNFLCSWQAHDRITEVLRIFGSSDICGSNVATKIINRTKYNRAIRVHKLTLEALERLQWNTFMEWLEKNGRD